MTTTAKLPTAFEMKLRQHCAISGESTNDVIRVALEAHLSAAAEITSASPWALGADYFGSYAGPAALSERFRDARGAVWDGVAASKSTRRTRQKP
jgi:hypothetical protein